MVEITSQIQINENELVFSFVRADGPGGQNVNKVATAVQLRFDIEKNNSLPEDAKLRLIQLAGNRVTQDGVLVLEARRFRTQERNREDALARFKSLVQRALEKPKKRKQSKPSATVVEKRLEQKKQRGELKRSRQRYIPDE